MQETSHRRRHRGHRGGTEQTAFLCATSVSSVSAAVSLFVSGTPIGNSL